MAVLPDPARALQVLSDERFPLLVGVRHHSVACALALPAILDAAEPERVLIELPSDLAEWLPWLGHPKARAPLALGASSDGDLRFYPFADFSPELVAVRWAVSRGVPCLPIDLPVGAMGTPEASEASHGLIQILAARASAPDAEALWDQLVEAPAQGAAPEAVRRAALAYGWALRADTPRTGDKVSRQRERHMRQCVEAARAEGVTRLVAVVGAFHAAGLCSDVTVDPLVRLQDTVVTSGVAMEGRTTPVTSLVPYAFAPLDSRSGYPAGVAHPMWHQRVFEAKGHTDRVVASLLVEVCRALRDERQVAGTPDASEALRVARGLAALRGNPAPGRRELLEGVHSALGQGEPLGRSRVLARTLDALLVGTGQGLLAPGTPRSGLAPDVTALLAALGLPGPDDGTRAKPMRLDPLRNERDRRRHVALQRLQAAGVDYGERADGMREDERLTVVWRVAYTAATEATLAEAGLRGVTLEQAANGSVRASLAALEASDRLAASLWLDVLEVCAEAALHELVASCLETLRWRVVEEASTADLVRGFHLVERLARGHFPGCPVSTDRRVRRDLGARRPRKRRLDPGLRPPHAEEGQRDVGFVPTLVLADVRLDEVREALLAAAVRGAAGMQGSDDPQDVAALIGLVRLFELDVDHVARQRLVDVVSTLTELGTPRMQGAAGGAQVVLGTADRAEVGARLGGWVDGCSSSASARMALSKRLQGLLVAIGPLVEGDPALHVPLVERVEALDDAAFMRCLPALRDGFEALSPASRGRWLDAAGGADGARASTPGEAQRLALAAADAEAAERVTAWLGAGVLLPWARPQVPAAPKGHGGSADRWRLILGQPPSTLPEAQRPLAEALDTLYGEGRGEGSRSDLAPSQDAPSFPSARAWGAALEALFGDDIRDEVVQIAAARGDPSVLGLLDPETVVPSVSLLTSLLSLKGRLPEADLVHFRRLVDRVVRDLAAALSVRLQRAFTGLSTPRATRRPTGRLDLRRTLAANLRHVRSGLDGPLLVPERLLFRTRARRALDWRLVLLVDTSGSMDASVVQAAMTAAILTRLPALSVHFVAFSTEVVDLTAHATDPLALLLEVEVGGGTHIARAVRYGRSLVTAPSRTLFVVISDFDEGGAVPVLVAEVRALVEMGVTVLGVSALDDEARPYCNVAVAGQLVAAGMPVAALTPEGFARYLAAHL